MYKDKLDKLDINIYNLVLQWTPSREQTEELRLGKNLKKSHSDKEHVSLYIDIERLYIYLYNIYLYIYIYLNIYRTFATH